MSEEALVNTGAVAWPDDFTASVMVRRMQAKLHRWAGGNLPASSVTCSTSSMTRRSWCTRGSACPPIRAPGLPGVDKATAASIETWIGVEAFLGQIATR